MQSAHEFVHNHNKLLQMIDAICDKQRASMKRSGLSAARFPHYPISRPVAAKIAELAGVKKPRPGYLVDVLHEMRDNDNGTTWVLGNRSGSYHLEARHH